MGEIVLKSGGNNAPHPPDLWNTSINENGERFGEGEKYMQSRGIFLDLYVPKLQIWEFSYKD